eukprot:TRINITY_DN73761_c0_g1_i1.p1 TRINITY_DN73761_c0_g1~~TRINITY_DN73761_c0_g1_i1.p1  ORF type:complete len:392 (-),score=63.89 TRINITY_DN73761_c0_g1_i1:126-1277(-)
MGNAVAPACTAPQVQPTSGLQDADAVQVDLVEEGDFATVTARWLNQYDFEVVLDKSSGAQLGLDLDFMSERQVLPIKTVKEGLAKQWNRTHPNMMIKAGDSIVKVNYAIADVSLMLELCKCDQPLEVTFRRTFTCDQLVADIRDLIMTKACGPALVRLSWQDNVSGCPDAALRFNLADDPDLTGIAMLQEIADKYCPLLIGHADLWALASTIAINMLGGPEIPVRFGRTDASSASQLARLGEDASAAEQLRGIFNQSTMNDRYIVALAGILGFCYGSTATSPDSGDIMDIHYFKDLMSGDGAEAETKPNVFNEFSMLNQAKSKPELRKTDHILKVYNKALVEDKAFNDIAKEYAVDQSLWFRDLAYAWVRFQELGWRDLRMML